MNVGHARAIFSAVWLGCSLPLVVLIEVRILKGFYFGESMELWAWIAQLLLPVVAIIVSSWFVSGGQAGSKPVHNPGVFGWTVALSIVYIGLLYAVVLIEPTSQLDWVETFRTSGFYLGLLQAVVILAIGKFYIENH